eukprot:1708979-Prymnesium_polylepis.1
MHIVRAIQVKAYDKVAHAGKATSMDAFYLSTLCVRSVVIEKFMDNTPAPWVLPVSTSLLPDETDLGCHPFSR